MCVNGFFFECFVCVLSFVVVCRCVYLLLIVFVDDR